MKKESEQEIQIKKQKSLNYSIKDGAAASIDANIQATYIPQFALAMKGSSFQVGLINAFAGILSPLSQLFGDKLMESSSRKKIIGTFILLQIMMLMGISALAYLFWKGIFQEFMIYILIILYSLTAVCGGIAYPAWFSWLGDLTSKNARGKFFSRRNIVTTLAGMLVIPAGLILDKIELAGYLMLGFSALFIISAISRTISLCYIKKQYEPKFKLKKGYYFSLLDFLKRFDEVGKFAVYYAIFEVAIMFASPFFAVYMKEGLNLNYLQITIISLSSSIFYMLSAPIMGKISDKYGNVKLFFVSTLLLSLNPILWIFLKSFWSLALIPQLIVGVSNAALAISVTNFIYSMTSQERRALCVSYLNILVGAGTFVGSIIGGLTIKLMPSITSVSPFIILFTIAGLARLIISIGLVAKLKETEDKVKQYPKVKLNFLHPLKTIHSEINLIRKLAH